MEYFLITLVTVAVMLAYAVPGFALVKSKAISKDSAVAFSKVLMYVAQPCLTVYSFQKATFSLELLKNMGIFFGLCVLIHAVMMGGMVLIWRKKSADIRYRICTVAATFGNCAFMGVPLLEALMPEYADAAVFSMVFFLVMSLCGWTAGSAVITHDKKYLSVKKMVLNPAVISLAIALPLFFANVKLPSVLGDAVTVMGKMTTPLCMLVMGMRLATIPVKPIFTDKLQYVTVAVKQFFMPFLSFLIVWWLPIDYNIKVIFYVLCATPVASVVLNFAEILGEGQQIAANMVLLGTVLSVATIPIIVLVL